jgi:hypothetical protein
MVCDAPTQGHKACEKSPVFRLLDMEEREMWGPGVQVGYM